MIQYPKYKATGIEWIQEIPDNWDLLTANKIFKEISKKNHPNETLLASTQIGRAHVLNSSHRIRHRMPSSA